LKVGVITPQFMVNKKQKTLWQHLSGYLSYMESLDVSTEYMV